MGRRWVAFWPVIFLLIAFILVPLVELYVIIKVGGAIGVGPTIFLLLLDSLLGAWLLRHQGRSAWVSFNRALSESRIPAKEVMDGVLIIFGGALLLTPGFVTDILGFILLIPPSRAIARAFMSRFALGRFGLGARTAAWGYGRVQNRRARRAGGPQPGPAGATGAGAGAGGAGAGNGARRAPGWNAGDDFSWEAPRTGRRPDDIEGTAHEVRDDEEGLPPGDRGVFPG